MPLVPNFSSSQVIGLPSTIYLLDSSTGSDVLIISRRVALIDAQGNYLTADGSFTTPTYTTWAYASSSTSIAALTSDFAINVTVDWLNAAGAVLYTKTTLYPYTLYGLEGSFALTQALTASPNIIQDQNYWLNRMILRCNIDDADNAVDIGGNIFIAQAALDREAYMLANQQLYF